jgi:hypothetical protein
MALILASALSRQNFRIGVTTAQRVTDRIFKLLRSLLVSRAHAERLRIGGPHRASASLSVTDLLQAAFILIRSHKVSPPLPEKQQRVRNLMLF